MINRYLHLATLLLGVTSLSAQITLTADNFGLGDTIAALDTVYLDNRIVVDPPQGGENMVWDYSDVVSDTIEILENTPVGEDTIFAGAISVSEAEREFQDFVFPVFNYEGANENGRFYLGETSPGAKFPLLSITGGANDTLAFPSYTLADSTPITRLPLSFGTSYVDSIVRVVPFTLTVAARQLDRVPGAQIENTAYHTDVIGYGTLILPQPGGTVTEPLEALLVRDSVVTLTTYTLGGGPAPAQLLGAFGLREVNRFVDVRYGFLVKGLGRAAARFQTPGIDTVNFRFSYRRVPAGTTTAIPGSSVSKLAFYPNPVRPGDVLRLSGGPELTAGTAYLIDARGRTVGQQRITTIPGGALEIEVPGGTAPGLYFYQLSDRSGQPVGIGKVRVR
jgi:hypothetical protein